VIIKGQRGRDNGGTQSILTRIHQPPAATIHPPNLECARTPCVALIGSEVSGQKLVERTDPAKNLDRRWMTIKNTQTSPSVLRAGLLST